MTISLSDRVDYSWQIGKLWSRPWGLVIVRELPGQHSQFLWCFPEKYFSVVQFAVGSDQRQRELRRGMRRKTVGKSERTHGRSNHCQGKQQQKCYKSEEKKTFTNPLKTRDNSHSDEITAKANNNNSFPFQSPAILSASDFWKDFWEKESFGPIVTLILFVSEMNGSSDPLRLFQNEMRKSFVNSLIVCLLR